MNWQLDKAHSEIQFSVRHMMISRVRGHFEEFDGTFEIDEQNPESSKIEVKVQTGSINTRNEQRDGHLQSPDFLDSEHYPVMTFTSSKVEQVDASHGRLTGDLTIKDITKPVVLEVEYVEQAKNPFTGQVSAGFTAKTEVDRKDWDMTWNQALETGGILVSDKVTINIELELIKN